MPEKTFDYKMFRREIRGMPRMVRVDDKKRQDALYKIFFKNYIQIWIDGGYIIIADNKYHKTEKYDELLKMYTVV